MSHTKDSFRYPAGNQKMFVHVNRPAITERLKTGIEYPTIIVTDEHKESREFHEVVVCGSLKFGEVDGVNAVVYLETYGEITGYTFHDAPESFVNRPQPEDSGVDLFEFRPKRAIAAVSRALFAYPWLSLWSWAKKSSILRKLFFLP